MILKRIIILTFVLLPFLGWSQIKKTGIPNIRNYPKTVYNGGTQNWCISQDSRGFMYFANNDGVLCFDGLRWEFLDVSIPLPVRSVFVDSKDRIYVGLTDDFGFIEPNESGKYGFTSFRHLVDGKVEFSDIWRIHAIENGIVFQAFEKLFIYHDEKISDYSPKEKYRFSFSVNGRFWVQEQNLGLFEFQNGNFQKLIWSEQLANEDIISIQEISDNIILIGTIRGFYKYDKIKLVRWESEASRLVNKGKLFSFTTLVDNYLAFGTILDGLIISDIDGNIIQYLSRENGLQNNTVLSLFSDRHDNLWLGLDNGIDYVEINSPLSYILEGGNIGTGYCSILHEDRLYLGTNQGLFVKSIQDFSEGKGNFRIVKNTEGQVWSLSVHNGQLICGHNFGTFLIKNETAIKINDEAGGWKYIQLKQNPDILVGGFYSGLAIFKFQNGNWRFYKKLHGFSESSRFICEDNDGNFWISHGAKGIFKLTPNTLLDSIISVTTYNSDSGLPSNQNNIVLNVDNTFYISTINGLYEYHSKTNDFMPSKKIPELAGMKGRIKALYTDKTGDIWFITEDESGVLRKNEDLTFTKITSPLKPLEKMYVPEFEFIYPFGKDDVLIGIENGFAHYSSKFPKSYGQTYSAYITKIEASYLDSVIFPEIITSKKIELPFKKNSFRFQFTSPLFDYPEDMMFSYILENYTDKWTDWSSDTYKDFSHLSPGEYTFKVKARNLFGTESETGYVDFKILPPWYRSALAYVIYSVLSVVLAVILILGFRYRIKRMKKRELLKHEKQMHEKQMQFKHQSVMAEKEIIKLRNDKLQADMIHRNKELANQTNNLIQKNQFLLKVNQELSRLSKETSDGAAKTKLAVIKRKIEREIDNKEQNKIFETYFDEVHKDFFDRLKHIYPQLSPKELRLCAFIKMNISTKEIASLLNISDRGAEIGRYRLRKKLELPRESNLSVFLSGI